MTDPCERCGATEGETHTWVEDDCMLPHGHGKPKHPPTAKIGWCCAGCVTRHEEWVTEIVTLYATLDQVLLTGSVDEQDSEYHKPRKAPASPSPIRLEAWCLLHPEQLNSVVIGDDGTRQHMELTGLPDIPTLLTNWAEAVYDAKGWGSEWPRTVSGAAAVLKVNASTIAALADVDTYDAELKWMRSALRHAHALPERKRVGLCPTLDGRGEECGGSLWQHPGGLMSVTCGRCGRHFDERFLSHLGGMIEPPATPSKAG